VGRSQENKRTLVCHGTVSVSEKFGGAVHKKLAVGDFGVCPAVCAVSGEVVHSESVGFLEVVDVETGHSIKSFDDVEVGFRLVGLVLDISACVI